MSSIATINSDRYSINIKTATALFYLGLLCLTANLVYFYSPVASFFIVFILLIQTRWKINHTLLKMMFVFSLMPLVVNLSALIFQQILILLFCGVSSLGSDVYIKFSDSAIFYMVHEILFFMMLLSITGMSAALFLLNIFFPICKKVIKFIISPLFFLPMLTGCFLSLFGGFETFIDSVDYLSGQLITPFQLIADKEINDYHIRAYRTDYQGALSAFGVEVKQEKYLPFHLKLVKDISDYDHCDNLKLNVLADNTIIIEPDIDSHETNRELLSPKTFHLKPFFTTKFLNNLTKTNHA